METYKTTKAINEYQTHKTIRFGLTATNQNLYSEEILNLINASEEKIKPKSKEKEIDLNKQLRDCLDGIKEYLKTWKNVYSQIDFLAITKDYYKVLSRKAKFDYNKDNGSEIKLSSLQSKYNDKKRYQYILDFWRENFIKVGNLYRKSDDLLKIFEDAVKQNRDDKKLNKVDLRKTFLSLFNLVNETLKPQIEGNLFIVNDDKIDEQNSKHTFVLDFIAKTKERKQLYDHISDLQNFFKDNGGYVPFGRATLNKWTAMQKSNHKNTEIDKIINGLKIVNVSMKNIDYKYDSFAENFWEEYKNGKKVWVLKPNVKSVIEICQYFKYKKVPINARLKIAERLKKDINFLSEFGISKSPALDYKNDKDNFNLANYPLKVAFDYAWENCAKDKDKHETITFPKDKCETYLKDNFDLDASIDSSGKIKNEHLNKYADLLQFKILLGRLKAEFYKTDEATNKNNIQKLRDVFISLDYHGDNRLDKKQIQDAVNAWFDNKEKNIGKKKEEEICLTEEEKNNFSLAMQIIGQERGGLKNRIEKYKTLTEMFKVCASEFGKKFAALREYFNEAYEVDKIKYRAWIIEDEQNRFVLLADKNKEIELIAEEGDLSFYEVKSLTSKTLWKLISNPEGAGKDFHTEDFYLNKKSGTTKNREFLTRNKLNYVKGCLRNSKMAIDQNWKDFNFDFSNRKTYEDIEKEIDRKGYKLQKNTISLAKITDLITNQECLLLPIVNQDINKDDKQAKNQFTKDWFDIFDNKKRLHPEFNLFYRFPTEDYPNTKFKNGTEKTKRYSRFQMLVHFGCEFIPNGDYLSKKEQIAIFNDDKEQAKKVKKYSERSEERRVGKECIR
jgi:hypothetical protein